MFCVNEELVLFDRRLCRTCWYILIITYKTNLRSSSELKCQFTSKKKAFLLSNTYASIGEDSRYLEVITGIFNADPSSAIHVSFITYKINLRSSLELTYQFIGTKESFSLNLRNIYASIGKNSRYLDVITGPFSTDPSSAIHSPIRWILVTSTRVHILSWRSRVSRMNAADSRESTVVPGAKKRGDLTPDT